MPRNPNGHEPQPADDTFLLQDVAPGLFDDFADIEISVEGKFKPIDLPGDRFIFIGPEQTVTLTNDDDPTVDPVTFGISGSWHQTTLEDGTVVTDAVGRNLLWGPFVNDGTPGLMLTIGHFHWEIDEDGTEVQSLNGDGRMIDVLALLE